jgi:hypothetical protein
MLKSSSSSICLRTSLICRFISDIPPPDARSDVPTTPPRPSFLDAVSGSDTAERPILVPRRASPSARFAPHRLDVAVVITVLLPVVVLVLVVVRARTTTHRARIVSITTTDARTRSRSRRFPERACDDHARVLPRRRPRAR